VERRGAGCFLVAFNLARCVLLTSLPRGRRCGNVFCGKCTSHRASLPEINARKAQRVCDDCFAHVGGAVLSSDSEGEGPASPHGLGRSVHGEWMRDSALHSCRCGAEFNRTCRRHHCR
jgi:hypothetical protein